MPTPPKPISDRQIASTALQSWDANAEETENEHELGLTVASELVEMGVPEDRAALAAQMAGKAFTAHLFPGKPVDAALKNDPLYKAMVAELRSGGYERPSAFSDGE